ncbi:hypothetical protein LCGC14_0405840 [marine sediment metagenome]|uniref:Uncharacterized protein n=1 Tax=marine sediment metagenome TaxID=412755 RepID=A0A0F9SV60_9ZZZZ
MAVGKYLPEANPGPAEDVAVTIKNLLEGLGGGSQLSHDQLDGLGDDDHTQYLLADGTRALSGAWDMGSQLITNLKLGGTMDANNQGISGASYLSQAGTPATGGFIRLANNQVIQWRNQGNTGNKSLYLDSTDVFVFTAPLYVMGALELTSGLTLGGALDANSQNIDNVNSILDVNSAQVVGTRVVDARCDDAINSGDATTDGVIDALRDAMISHGLIAAA